MRGAVRAARDGDAAAPLPTRRGIEIDLATSKIELVDGRYVVRGELVNNGRRQDRPAG